MTIRAIRNNNPGNIEAGDHWQGLMPRAVMTAEQASEPRFAVFENPMWGFRALVVVLLNYVRVHHLNSIRKIISRWAPNSENDTEAYVAAVAKSTGLSSDLPLDFSKPDLLAAMAKAIAVHECGGWFFKASDLNAGVQAAIAT